MGHFSIERAGRRASGDPGVVYWALRKASTRWTESAVAS